MIGGKENQKYNNLNKGCQERDWLGINTIITESAFDHVKSDYYLFRSRWTIVPCINRQTHLSCQSYAPIH